MHAEVFHIHSKGEQRGPYSIEQIRHLARCQLIDENTLYWRDGMEQWQPITQILPKKKKVMQHVAWRVLAIIAIVAGALMLAFGKVTREAWRELTSSEFTEEGAWWRARGVVRQQLPKGQHVQFSPFRPDEVKMLPDKNAAVHLSGKINSAADVHTWEVKLRYDQDRSDWSPWKPSEGVAPEK